MKIVVLDTAASKTGALSVLRDFYEYVKEYDDKHKWVFVVSDNYIENTNRIEVLVKNDIKKSRLKRLLFETFTGKKFLESLGGDVILSLQNTLPYFLETKTALYVHQPLGFQEAKNFSFFKKEERLYATYQHLICKLINSSIKRANKVFVQTEWMKNGVIKTTKVKSSKVIKILPDVDDYHKFGISEEMVVNPKENEEKIFFFPSGDVLYKNHKCLLEATRILKHSNINNFSVKVTLTEAELKARCGSELYNEVKDYVIATGQVTREEVYKNYVNSVLVFPSYIETFGYPLAEAKSVNGMIFAADEPFAHDILKYYDNVYYFDEFKPEELADLMKKVINGEIKRLPLSEETMEAKKTENKENSFGRIIKEIETI